MSVEDYASHFGLRAERMPVRKGSPKYAIMPTRGYAWKNQPFTIQFADTASEAKFTVNVMSNFHQVCEHCGHDREGRYGNVN